jgi:hypothetical protein
MAVMKRFWILLLVLGICSCAIHTTSLRAQNDKRLLQLDKEKDKLRRQNDPVDYTKTQIKISEILLSLISDSVREGALDVMGERLEGYVNAIQAAHQTMVKTGRDAHKKPKGFKDLEISLRRQVRQLEDIGQALTFDDREPVERAKERAADIRDELLKALFGEQNAPSRKG